VEENKEERARRGGREKRKKERRGIRLNSINITIY